MKKLSYASVAALVLILAATPALAKDKDGKKGNQATHNQTVRAPAQHTGSAREPWLAVDVQLPGREENDHDYFNSHPHLYKNRHHPVQMNSHAKALPPGLAKKVARGGTLPPGWQKKLVVGQVMPEEIYVHAEPVPPRVMTQLPPARKGTITVVISGKIVRLLEATLEILDVFEVGHLSDPL